MVEWVKISKRLFIFKLVLGLLFIEMEINSADNRFWRGSVLLMGFGMAKCPTKSHPKSTEIPEIPAKKLPPTLLSNSSPKSRSPFQFLKKHPSSAE
jgi:hypothetical protein